MSVAPEDRVLDWKAIYDERSKNFPVRTAIRSTVERKNKMWTPGPVLDQGREGACVGFAWAAQTLAKPIPVNLFELKDHAPVTGNKYASFLYGQARYLDEWAGENYEGTSVLAGAKASQNMNTLKEYRWAFSVNDIVDAVLTKGPVVIGVNWYDGMYEAPGGVLKKSGPLVGGHALLIVGYKLSSDKIPGKETFVIQNSWGRSWGENGFAEMTLEDFATLFSEGGEACVPTRRSYGR